MTTDKRVAKLKEASRIRDIDSFCGLLAPALQADFDKWFWIVREQRLLENFRDPVLIESIRLALYSSLAGRPECFLCMSNHVEVCLFAQRVFDQIDAEAAAVSAEPVNRHHYNETVIQVSEIVFEAERRKIEAQIASGIKLTKIHQLMGSEDFLRDVADCCNVLLNSRNPIRSSDAIKELSRSTDFDRLIGLALKYLDVKSVFDLYACGRYEAISCSSASVRFADKSSLRTTAGGVAAERNASNDSTRKHPIDFVELELLEQLEKPADDENFDVFISRQTSRAALMRRLADAVAWDLKWEVEEYFDVNTVVDSSRDISVLDLICCWAVLRVFAILAGNWQHSRSWNSVRENSVARVARSLIVKSVQQFISCSGSKARALVRRFQAAADKNPVDLFFTPLVATERPSVVLLASRFIAAGRFDRNLFSILVSDGVIDQDSKGFRPVSSLVESFETAGFSAIGNLAVSYNGKPLTDVDIAAYKERKLFVGQAKVVIEPDTVYDGWKAEKRLEHAAEQLRNSLLCQDQIIAALSKKYPGVEIAVEEVLPFILTNTRRFTEFLIEGFTVVDLPYVNFVLAGAEGTGILMSSSQIGISSGKKYIAGDHPTAQELRDLIRDTIHQVKRRFKACGTRELAVGGYKITAPTVMLHPPPYPFMKVLEEGEAEKFLAGEQVPFDS